MKKPNVSIIFLVLSVLAISFLVGCAAATSSSTPGEIFVYAFIPAIGGPTIYLTDGGPNFSYIVNPVTGTSIAGATVTVSNETTGISSIAAYTDVPTMSARPLYVVWSFSHAATEIVSLTIQKDGTAITGTATTPSSVLSNLKPPNSTTVQFPFIVSWEVTGGSNDPSHVMVNIQDAYFASGEANNYREYVPIAQTSIEVTSAEVQAGTYSILVMGVNAMSLTGAKAQSIGYVGGGVVPYNLTITAEVTP